MKKFLAIILALSMIFALCAVVSTRLRHLTMMLAAVWANNIVAPTCFSECLLTGLFVNEVVGYCDEGVELCKIYHGKRCV